MLKDYKEFIILPNTILLFKDVPSKENLDELRKFIDKIEETNSYWPI